LYLLQVSNDQLRDHVWNLLRAKHFLKWRERHIVNFDFPRLPNLSYDFDSPLLLPPKPYTGCVQVGGRVSDVTGVGHVAWKLLPVWGRRTAAAVVAEDSSAAC
jgi:hypothetical protein